MPPTRSLSATKRDHCANLNCTHVNVPIIAVTVSLDKAICWRAVIIWKMHEQ